MTARKPSTAELRFGHPLAQGLIGAWFMTEGNGTSTLDSSSYNNPSTVSGAFWSTPPGPNTGFTLDSGNTGNVVSIPVTSTLRLIGSPFSIVALVYPRSYGGASKGRIIDDLSTGLNGWDLYIDNANVTTGYSVQLDGNAVHCANAVTLNTWQHVAFTIDPSFTFHFYVNGVDAGNNGGGSNAGSLVVNGSGSVANMLIGDWAGAGGRQFDGFIDYVLLYNRSLSENEVAQLYSDPYQMIRPRSIGWRSTNQILTPQIWM